LICQVKVYNLRNVSVNNTYATLLCKHIPQVINFNLTDQCCTETFFEEI
jgi:hypothetical protein